MEEFKRVVKKVVKWSLIGGAVSGAYGLGRMNSSPGYIRYRKGHR